MPYSWNGHVTWSLTPAQTHITLQYRVEQVEWVVPASTETDIMPSILTGHNGIRWAMVCINQTKFVGTLSKQFFFGKFDGHKCLSYININHAWLWHLIWYQLQWKDINTSKIYSSTRNFVVWWDMEVNKWTHRAMMLKTQ